MFVKKLKNSYIWKRIYYERLTEPLHLNAIALLVSAFGSYRSKIDHDLVLRHQHAWSILKCADTALSLGLKQVTLLEFGVANGAGLMNICKIADKVSKETGIIFDIYGFDTGKGMPPPKSYRDHPELYQSGDFPMDSEALENALPMNAKLILGEIHDTVGAFIENLSPSSPIGFVSIDVDYYSSTRDALKILKGNPGLYLPRVIVYLDDLEDESHNSWCGELLAVSEFNDENEFRKIERHHFLRSYRIFKNARWIDHMFTCHVLDHRTRNLLIQSREKVTLSNPHLP